MSFIWPTMLFSLLLIPLLVVGYWWLLQRQARQTAVLDSLGFLQTSRGQQLGWWRHLPFAIFLLAISLLLVSLARPQAPVNLPRVEGTVMLAFDVSSSMIAEDLEPSRMVAAKEAARTFVENQPSTVQVGVVAFGNGGLIVQQPTNITADLLDAIDRLTPMGSTSLGQGIFTALNAIAGKSILAGSEDEPSPENLEEIDFGYFGSAVIVLLSDGENMEEPNPLDMAQLAANAGVRIFPVGIGSREGAVIDLDGFRVATVLNEEILEEIAGVTNGRYFYAADETDLQAIYDTIDLQLTIRGEQL
ncbi:MAG: VWA domain-containing protein, partial [Chloroflexota bacterium]